MIEKINKKISSKKAEIRRLEKEIAQLELERHDILLKWKNTLINAPKKYTGIFNFHIDDIDND